ncbi:MAG: IS66 family insertion sequence element accessory protein TnpB [Candidatus Latescibacterota bacterium]
MLALSAATRIYLYRGAADMRCSFDGLCGLARSHLQGDPLSGALFVFVNRRRTLVKILCWEGDGLAIYAKRLEQGTFRVPVGDAPSAEIDRRSLAMLLEGVTPRRLSPRYQLTHAAAAPIAVAPVAGAAGQRTFASAAGS